MKVMFLHGLESSPVSTKATFLRQLGYEVIAPALGRSSFEDSVDIAQASYDENLPDVIVGSSRGGAVAMRLRAPEARLVLIAPAWQKYGVDSKVPKSTKLIHSLDDDVIPIQHSVLLSLTLDREALIIAGESHRMMDDEALEAIGNAVMGVEKNERQ